MRLVGGGIFCRLFVLASSLLVAAQPSVINKISKRGVSLPSGLLFVKNGRVYVTPPTGSAPENWCSSSNIADIAISPDASALALTLFLSKPDSKRLSPARRIAILHSKGSTPKVLESVPGENSYGPVWSPDSQSLMFNHLSGGKWNVAVVNRDGSGFRILASPISTNPIIQCAFWASDGKSLYAYDSSNLYQIGLDGRELGRTPFSEWSIMLTTTGGKMALSPDGARFLLEAEVDTHEKDDPMSSSPVVYVCEMRSHKKLAITSKHGELSKPSWLSDNVIVFSATEKGHTRIYRKDLKTGAETLMIADASAPNISKAISVH